MSDRCCLIAHMGRMFIALGGSFWHCLANSFSTPPSLACHGSVCIHSFPPSSMSGYICLNTNLFTLGCSMHVEKDLSRLQQTENTVSFLHNVLMCAIKPHPFFKVYQTFEFSFFISQCLSVNSPTGTGTRLSSQEKYNQSFQQTSQNHMFTFKSQCPLEAAVRLYHSDYCLFPVSYCNNQVVIFSKICFSNFKFNAAACSKKGTNKMEILIKIILIKYSTVSILDDSRISRQGYHDYI